MLKTANLICQFNKAWAQRNPLDLYHNKFGFYFLFFSEH